MWVCVCVWVWGVEYCGAQVFVKAPLVRKTHPAKRGEARCVLAHQLHAFHPQFQQSCGVSEWRAGAVPRGTSVRGAVVEARDLERTAAPPPPPPPSTASSFMRAFVYASAASTYHPARNAVFPSVHLGKRACRAPSRFAHASDVQGLEKEREWTERCRDSRSPLRRARRALHPRKKGHWWRASWIEADFVSLRV